MASRPEMAVISAGVGSDRTRRRPWRPRSSQSTSEAALPAFSGSEMEMIESLLSAWWIWAVPVAFLAVLFYAFNPKRKKQFEKEARVPLEDDPPVK